MSATVANIAATATILLFLTLWHGVAASRPRARSIAWAALALYVAAASVLLVREGAFFRPVTPSEEGDSALPH